MNRETHDVLMRPRFLRDLLWPFFDKKSDETFMLDEDRMRLVEQGIIKKGSDGRYLLTEKGQEAIDAENDLWEQWAGIIR